MILRPRWRLADFLGVLMATLATAAGSAGADARMNLSNKTLIEITGGNGSRTWVMRYGTGDFYQKRFVTAGANHAWFSHGGWLRRLDIARGLVTGRWHFPGSIVNLVPADGRVQVQLEDKDNGRVFARLTMFDPEAGTAIPYWPSGSLVLNRVPFAEAESAWGTPTKIAILTEGWRASPDMDLKQLIAQLEEAVRRDPVTPAFRVALWRVLREAGDARAPGVLEEALRVKHTDFTEMLRIASLLESLDQREAARAAFELGYRDFLDRGNDPRLMMGLLGKLILYQPQPSKLLDPSSDHGRELMERHYLMAPRAEAADLAWNTWADLLEKNGQAEEARKWRIRAQEAAATAVFLMPRSLALLSDTILLAVIAAMISAVLYFVLLWIRYRHERRADSAPLTGRGLLGRALADLNFQYWSRSQRIAFLSIILVAWIGTGIEAGILRGIQRTAATPLGMAMGSLAGPVSVWHLQNRVPATPERDLLLAIAYQQSGQLEPAERLYQALPYFAESWNNLGLILKSKGKDRESKQAFEKALQLDPMLAEAALNLGQPPRGIWAEQFARYFPGRPMLAPPRTERLFVAFFGASMGRVVLRGWAGPFREAHPWGAFTLPGGVRSEEAPATAILTWIFVAGLGLALALFFVPYRRPAQPPPRISTALEVFFPGQSPAWSVFGGLVLAAWVFLLLQDILMVKIGTPYILTSIAMPNVSRPYGLPISDPSSLLRMLNPGWVWVYLVPAVLFAANLTFVLLSRRVKEPAREGERV